MLIGVLRLFGAELDPVLMLNVIMAVGFSVDYTAHIIYHFYRSDCVREDPVRFLLHTKRPN